MKNIKLLRWCFGVTVLSLGLSACMDMPRSEQQRTDIQSYEKMNPQPQQTVAKKAKSQPQQKTYASKDPTQKATPGPTRKAAPQIPVIQ